jgi:hypothetical protein
MSKQTQNQLQILLDSFKFDYSNLYSIADNKTKKRLNTLVEEWFEKGLLTNRLSKVHNDIDNINVNSINQFGLYANNIYKRTRVKNSDILELLIYSVYAEEQFKLEEKEQKIFKEDVNYYYEEGQKEVNKNKVSVISDALFLSLLNQATINGFTYEQYNEARMKYNTDQIYKQAVIDIQQKKDIKIDSDIYQDIIKKQNNSRLNINDDKYSGSIETLLVGMSNQAKIEGITKNDEDAKVMFIAVEDDRTTKMCQSLDRQIFNVKNWNEFKRYSDSNKNIVKYRCRGLVIGLNLPPVVDHFHWCRSTIQYLHIINEQIKNRKKTIITEKTIDNMQEIKLNEYNIEENRKINEWHKELLRYSMEENNSNEVVFVLDKNLKLVLKNKGDIENIDFSVPVTGKDYFIIHNHPKNSSFSTTDIITFLEDNNIKSLSIVKNNGKIEVITKKDDFEVNKSFTTYRRMYKKIIKNTKPTDDNLDDFVEKYLEKEEQIIWKR